MTAAAAPMARPSEKINEPDNVRNPDSSSLSLLNQDRDREKNKLTGEETSVLS